MVMKTMLIVDGNSILNRAFYGVRPLTTKGGLPTNAIYGMCTMLLKQMESLPIAYGAVAFDLREPTFRHKEYANYKANRKGMPEELAIQLPYAKECVTDLGFLVLEKAGYEADDILGTLAQFASQEDLHIFIFTGDRDALQLINESVTVLLATNQETIPYDTAKFVETYGILPTQFVDVKALMGDSSDMIPGVAGIGEKTALKLIAEYQTLENLYDGIEAKEIAKGAKTKLIAGKESAYLSRFLAQIDRQTPLDCTMDNLLYQGIQKSALYTLFTELEFSALIKRLALEQDAPPLQEITLSIETLYTLPKEPWYALFYRPEENLIQITDGKTSYTCQFETIESLRPFFEDAARSFYLYSSKELYSLLRTSGISVCATIFDGMLAAYDVNPATAVSCPTVEVLYNTGVSLQQQLVENKQKEFYDTVELPLARVLSEMEQTGFKIDRSGLKKFSQILQDSSDASMERIYLEANCIFNINSPKQLGEILFEKLGLPTGRKTKTGYSTDADVLEKLRPYHPIIRDILEYRQVMKLKSTYADGLLKVADETDRVHSTFHQALTSTGRLSSSEPNLQNIPIRQELGRELRRFFVAQNENYVLIDADYSQIELRLLAAIAEDESMIAAFHSGIDIHTLTASQVFGVPQEQVTLELRKRAKAVNFGIVYGIGEFSLSEDIGVSMWEAGEYIRQYLATYPKVDSYLKNIVTTAYAQGYVTTLFGRRRYIPELTATKKTLRNFGERVAMNSPIQGTAADIIKIAMVKVQRSLKENGLDAHLILQVHDELIVESNRECAEQAAHILKEEMEHAVSLQVPLPVTIGIGDNWFVCEE